MREDGSLSDETVQPSTVAQHGEPSGARGSTDEGQAPRGLAEVAAAVAAGSVLATGAAFLIGWSYTTAFYDRLGVPTGALDLEPIDYMAAKVEIWYAVAVAVLITVGSTVTTLRLPSALKRLPLTGLPRRLFGEFAPQRAFAANFAIGTIMLLAGAWGLALTGNQTFLYVFVPGLTYAPVGLWGLMRESPGWRPLSAGVALAFAAFLAVTSVPTVAAELGRHDAEALLTASEPATARLVAASALGLPGEHCEASGCVTDSVQVVAATSSSYFVVVQGTQTVYCLPAGGLLRMEYDPDKGR